MARRLPVLESIFRIDLRVVLDIALVATCIYWLFSLIRGTRAVTLVIGVSVLLVVYAIAVVDRHWRCSRRSSGVGGRGRGRARSSCSSRSCGARWRRIGRRGSFGWLLSPADRAAIERTTSEIARAAAQLSREKHGALVVIERETGLEDTAESGVMLHADLTAELLVTIFMPARRSTTGRSSCARTGSSRRARCCRSPRRRSSRSGSGRGTAPRSASPRRPTRWSSWCPRRTAR
jgi:hypothetical protein